MNAGTNESSGIENTDSRDIGTDRKEKVGETRRRGRPPQKPIGTETGKRASGGDKHLVGIHPIKKEEIEEAYPGTAFRSIENNGKPFGILRAREDFIMKNTL